MRQEVDLLKSYRSQGDCHLVLWLSPLFLTIAFVMVVYFIQYQSLLKLKEQWSDVSIDNTSLKAPIDSNGYFESSGINDSQKIYNILSIFIGDDIDGVEVNSIIVDKSLSVKVSGYSKNIEALSKYIAYSQNKTPFDVLISHKLSIINPAAEDSIQWEAVWE